MVDSDHTVASPPTNPTQNGKRDAEKVVEAQGADIKRQKIVNVAPETEESKKVEVPLAIKTAKTTQDVERAGISDGYDEDRDDSSNEEHEHVQATNKSAQTPLSSQATGSKIVLMDNLSFSVEEDDVKNFFKNVGDITEVHIDTKEARCAGHGHVKFTTEKAALEALKLNNELLLGNPVRLDLATERADHPTTQASGPKTLFLGNLSFAIEEDDVRDFFKDVGEIADIRFAIKDDRFLGRAYIEFTTAEAAQEALKLNKKVILDRPVKLELARERGAYTLGNRYKACSIEKSNQRRGLASGKTKTIYVRGFDYNDGFDNIRRTLEKHFGECGEISRLAIPKDHESGAPRGVAFIEFVHSNGFIQALGLHGSEVGGCRLIVEEAKKQLGEVGWSSRSSSCGGWVRENGWGRDDSRGGWARESSSSRESGSGSSWHSKSYSGSGWVGRSGSSHGGGRASGYGFSGGWRSGSGSLGGGNVSNSSRVGGGWSAYAGSGYSSGGSRVGSRFSGSYASRGSGPSGRP